MPVMLWVVLGMFLLAAAVGGVFLMREHRKDTGGFPAVTEWIEHRPQGAGYSVRMPQIPVRSTETRTVSGQELEMVLYSVETPSAVCAVMHTGVQPAYQTDDPKSVLDGSVLGATTNVVGRAYWEQDVTVDGYPGRDVAIRTFRGVELHLRMRIVLANGRLYVAQGVQPEKPGKWTEDFVKSLRIVP